MSRRRPAECETCKALREQIEFLKAQVTEKDVFIRELSLAYRTKLDDYAHPVQSPLARPKQEIEDGLMKIYDVETGESVRVPPAAIGKGDADPDSRGDPLREVKSGPRVQGTD